MPNQELPCSNKTVCLISSDIQFLLKELKRKVKSKSSVEEILYDLSLVSEKVRLVQKKAQKMEKRLKQYRDSIEKLGFERVN